MIEERSFEFALTDLKPIRIGFDTETTGLQEGCEMIQIGLVKENGASFSKYFLPTKSPISDSAFKTHGLSIDFLKRQGAEPFSAKDALEILEFIGTNN